MSEPLKPNHTSWCSIHQALTRHINDQCVPCLDVAVARADSERAKKRHPGTEHLLPSKRHPGTEHLLSLFEYGHLPPALQEVSKPLRDVAHDMVYALGDGPELTAGLRKLWEAKNCFVAQAVIEMKAAGETPKNNPEPELRR